MKFPVALQLYSVRDFMERDFEGTLRRVAAMGYDGVEFAGTFGRTAAKVRDLCEACGLVPVSAHVPLAEMQADPQGVIRYYKQVGCAHLVIPYLPEDRRAGTPGFEETLAFAASFGAMVTASGMTLQYHNHDFEFVRLGDEYALDYIYRTVPADCLQTQIDTCWARVGGVDPAAYIRQYAGRAPTVHLKDYSGTKSEKMYALIGLDDSGDTAAGSSAFRLRPCGMGCQDFAAILAASRQAGTGWMIIEQDTVSDGLTSLQCAEKSLAYIQTINK